MKKITSLLFVLCCIISLTACGNNTTTSNGSTGNQDQTEKNSSDGKTMDELLKETDRTEEKIDFSNFNNNATIAETVLIDEKGVKVTATGLRYMLPAIYLDITIENNSDRNLSFTSGNWNSVNGYMVSDGELHYRVAKGEKKNADIWFNSAELIRSGINEISDIVIEFVVSDDDRNYVERCSRQVKTTAFDSHDYNKNYYQENITSRAAMNTYGYDITQFSRDMLYDENGIKLISNTVLINRDGDMHLLLELENTTGSMVYIDASDIVLNGLLVRSDYHNTIINPRSHGIIDINISNVMDSRYWDIYGIKEVGSISLSLNQCNSDGDEITDPVSIEVVIPDVKAEYDSTGREVYNNNGLRIVSKTVIEDSLETTEDMYILLLVENNSGTTLTVDNMIDILTVNGYTGGCGCYGKKIENGESAVLEIQLYPYTVEEENISSVSDVKDIEIRLDIKEDSKIIDDPVVKISFK